MNLKLKAKILLGVMMLTPVVNFTEAAPKVFAAERVDNNIDQRQLNRYLYEAVIRGDEARVSALLNQGAQVDYVEGGAARLTLLHHAVISSRYGSHIGVARALLNAGANLHATDGADRTVLFCAIDANDIEMVRFLLNSGANLDINVICGNWTPLQWAVMHGYFIMVQELLGSGALVDELAMQLARRNGNADMIDMLRTGNNIQ